MPRSARSASALERYFFLAQRGLRAAGTGGHLSVAGFGATQPSASIARAPSGVIA